MLTSPDNQVRAYRASAARWLKADDIARLGARGEIRHRFSFSRAERQAFRRRRYVKPSEWAPRERYVTGGMLAGNPLNMRITPYAAGIMDAAVLPFVRQVAICAAPQVAKTTIIDTVLAWLAVFQPGPVLSVYPDEKTGKENMSDNIQPMFKTSPQLRAMLTGRKQDVTDTLLRTATMGWRIGWAGSAISLANRAIRYLDCQEVDKYVDRPNKRETDTISLARIRVRSYPHNHKQFYSSSPTTEDGNIWRIIAHETKALFVYWVTCPHCMTEQLMEFSRERFWWPHDEAGHSLDRMEIKERHLARYICPHCSAEWTDHHRNQAILLGTWRLQMTDDRGQKTEEPGEELFRYLRSERPESIGFLIPSWISYMVSLSEVAHDFLRSVDKDLSPAERFGAYQDFCNKHKAEPWRLQVTAASDETVLKATGALPPQVVPVEAVGLTCGIDVQKYGFWYVVRAWARDYTSWLVQYGSVATWADVEALLFETRWPVDGSADRTAGIWRAGIDTGGGAGEGMLSMTEETYFWLRRNMVGRGCRVWGTKGASRPLASRLQVGRPLDKSPSGKPIPGGLQIVSLNTDALKDTVSYRLAQAAAGGEMAAWLHSDTGPDYARQITAEARHVDDKGRDTWVQLRRDNHLFDCEVIAHALADPEWPGGGVNLLRGVGEVAPGRRVRSAGVAPSGAGG